MGKNFAAALLVCFFNICVFQQSTKPRHHKTISNYLVT